MIRQFLCAAALMAVCIGTASARDASDNRKVTLVYDHEIPNVPGKSIRGVLVEYGPGGSNPAHTHPKSAFIYATVLEGAIKSQVNDGPVTTYRAGESWSEQPGDRHLVRIFLLGPLARQSKLLCRDWPESRCRSDQTAGRSVPPAVTR